MYNEAYIKLLRPKDWAKNAFLFIPLFFSGNLFDAPRLEHLVAGFFAFSFVASTVYILNDYRDIEDDRKHPIKSKRPLASGNVKPAAAIVIAGLLLLFGFTAAYFADNSLRFM